MNTIQLTSENASSVFNEIQRKLRNARFVVALTGAGISIASGLPLLGDMIRGVPLKQFFEGELLETNPVMYYTVYREVLVNWRAAKPNRAHRALARAGVWVVTQNIDGLHRDAGTEHLLELHGNVRELRCASCGLIRDSSIVHEVSVPTCEQCTLPLRPGIVLNGEEVRHYSRAVDWVGRSEVLLIVGTQLQMSPVCELERIAEAERAQVVWINEASELWLPRLFAWKS